MGNRRKLVVSPSRQGKTCHAPLKPIFYQSLRNLFCISNIPFIHYNMIFSKRICIIIDRSSNVLHFDQNPYRI